MTLRLFFSLILYLSQNKKNTQSCFPFITITLKIAQQYFASYEVWKNSKFYRLLSASNQTEKGLKGGVFHINNERSVFQIGLGEEVRYPIHSWMIGRENSK